MSDVELPIVERIQAMELRENDAIVLTVPEKTTQQQGRLLCDVVERAFPGHRALVLPGDIELSLVRDVEEAWEQD